METETSPSFLPALLNTAMVYGQYLNDMEKATAYLQQYVDKGGTMQREMLEGRLAGSDQGAESPGPES